MPFHMGPPKTMSQCGAYGFMNLTFVGAAQGSYLTTVEIEMLDGLCSPVSCLYTASMLRKQAYASQRLKSLLCQAKNIFWQLPTRPILPSGRLIEPVDRLQDCCCRG